MQQPTIGRIVHYTLSEDDADAIGRQRASTVGSYSYNRAMAGEAYPAVIVRCFGGPAVNLQVLLDGVDSFWATSRTEGEGPGSWAWPAKSLTP